MTKKAGSFEPLRAIAFKPRVLPVRTCDSSRGIVFESDASFEDFPVRLLNLPSLELVQGNPPQAAEVLGTVVHPQPTLILSHAHVQAPVQAVLHAAVTANGFRKSDRPDIIKEGY